jgi:hypothetical protein
MVRGKIGISFLCAAVIVCGAHVAVAQSSNGLSLCLSRSGQIKAASRCRVGDTILSQSNFARALGLSSAPVVNGTPAPGQAGATIDVSTCQVSRAQRSASTFDGRIAVGAQCSKSSQILFSHDFATSDTTGAKPKLERSRLLFSGNVPNGVEIGTVGEANRFYTLSVTTVCCNQK